jgi:excisionase family DNA binding protein
MHRFYTTYEAAHLLGVSLPTVVNWIKGRRLKAHRTPGGHRRIAREELAAFMARHGMPLPPELEGAVEKGRRALVVGAAGPVREGLAREVARGGFAVQQCAEGFAAGLLAGRARPDVVVLLAAAPDGGDTLAGLRADPELAAVPVVAIGHAEWGARLRAAGAGAALALPVGDGQLAAAAAQALALVSAAARRGA